MEIIMLPTPERGADTGAGAEFDAAFAEATASTDAPASEPAAPAPTPALTPQAGSEIIDNEGLASEDAFKDADTSPSASAEYGKAPSNPPPQAGGTVESRPAPLSDSEIKALFAEPGVDPRLLAAFEATQQAMKSDRGRVAAYQRQIKELSATKANTAATEAAADAYDLFNSPELQEAAETFPDVVKPLLNVVQRLTEKVRSIESSTSSDKEARLASAAEDADAAELNAVLTAHADYETIIRDQGFADWVSQNPHLHPVVIANGAKIVDATSVNSFLDQFKRDTVWKGSAPPAGGNPVPGQSIDARRLRQIDGSRRVPLGGSPGAANNLAPDSFEGAFAEAADRIR